VPGVVRLKKGVVNPDLVSLLQGGALRKSPLQAYAYARPKGRCLKAIAFDSVRARKRLSCVMAREHLLLEEFGLKAQTRNFSFGLLIHEESTEQI
jgi:hypothetical protein